MISNYKEKRLSLVGTGIKTISHLTKESESHVRQADIVLSLVNEPVMMEWIEKYSKKNINLDKVYFGSNKRKKAYSEITEYILKKINEYDFVCVVFYGHPTVFSSPGLEAIRKADKLGVNTVVLSAISAEDCMFSDLKINPGDRGCYSVEATDFVLYNRKFDSNSHLIIWQIAMFGNLGHKQNINTKLIDILRDYLLQFYPNSHVIYLYEASLYPGMDPNITKTVLGDLSEQKYTTITSLYIPPLDNGVIDSVTLKKIQEASVI